jgi:regulator of protease activity HflC (stomatin/prohibitin superfamily)
MLVLVLAILIAAFSVIAIVSGVGGNIAGLSLGAGAGMIAIAIVCWTVLTFLVFGLHVLKPNEAYVFTIFGKYFGSLKNAGFYFVNPFAVPTKVNGKPSGFQIAGNGTTVWQPTPRKISLKAMTLNNDRQKINDQIGNPIEIGIVVIWRVVNTAKAIFNVDDYESFLSTQCDSALRNIVRLYPYDLPGEEDELSLRGSSQEIAEKLKAAIQEKVDVAGIDVMEARITHLAYSSEIAAAMLQRQQAAAIVDARTLIVKGAVGMVEQALRELNENGIVDLDEERKAAMVSNLLVVLCAGKDAQPVVNSGSLY